MEKMFLYVMKDKSKYQARTETVNVKIANSTLELKQIIGTVLLICVIMLNKLL
jgi:hypothetical protein